MQKVAALAALLPLVAGHGFISSPTPRKPGSAYQAACGQQPFNQQSADINGNVQGILQVAGTDFDASKCNLWLCKGFLLEDNTDSVESYTAGQTVDFKINIAAPHTGYANVSVVKTSSNSIIGTPLIEFTNYASNAGVAANNSAFSVTIPNDLGSECSTAGDCVLQWFWDAPDIDQTYESCVDFTVGGSGSGPGSGSASETPAATSAVAVSSAAASSAAATTSLNQDASSSEAASTPVYTTPSAPATTPSSSADTGADDEDCDDEEGGDSSADDGSADDDEDCDDDEPTAAATATDAAVTQVSQPSTSAGSNSGSSGSSSSGSSNSGSSGSSNSGSSSGSSNSGSSGSSNSGSNSGSSGSSGSGSGSAVTSYITVTPETVTVSAAAQTQYVTVTVSGNAAACT